MATDSASVPHGTSKFLGHIALAVFGTLLIAAIPVFAQSGAIGVTGTINGIVKDPSGANIPQAKVIARNLDQGTTFEVTTDSRGYFTLANLTLGSYQITVEASGFKRYVRRGIVIYVNDHLNLPVTLQVGSTRQTVTVTGTPPLLTPTTASLGVVVNNKMVRDLPLNGRNPFALQQLVSGVIPNGDSGNVNFTQPWNTNSISDLSTDGAPGRGNMLAINGLYAKGGNQVSYTPSPDAVAEFKVEKNPYNAAVGHVAGGLFNVITKSGTNRFHGDLYEFARNRVLDANTFFSNAANGTKPEFGFNQFGGEAGGPLMLPGYNGKNKVFWFFNYEGARESTPPSTEITTLPTAAERNGDFSALLNQYPIYNPYTTSGCTSSGGACRTAFAGNIIPSGDISPIASKVMTYIPLPNGPGLTNNYSSSSAGYATYNNFYTRVDENISSKSRMFEMVGISRYYTGYPNFFHNISTNDSNNIHFGVANLDFNHTFSPTWLADISIGFARKYQFAGFQSFDPATLGFPQDLVSQLPYAVFPQFSIGDAGSSFGIGGPSYNGSDGWNLNFSFTHVRGRQTMQWGFYGLLLMETDDGNGGNGASGQYSFGRDWTQANPLNNATAADSGYGFATFLLGIPSSGHVGRGALRATQTTFYEPFIQDNIRITPRLTLNLGLRYNFQGPTTERHNKSVQQWDLSVPQAINPQAQANYANVTVPYIEAYNAANPGNPLSYVPVTNFQTLGVPVFAGVNGNTRREYAPEYTDFGPRLGLAYHPIHNLVLRTGFGIFYNPRLTGVDLNGFSVTTPLVQAIPGQLPSAFLANPYPSGLLPVPCNSRAANCLLGEGVNLGQYQDTTTRILNWSAGIQYLLPQNWLLEMSYMGTRGDHFNPSYALDSFNPSYLSMGAGLFQPVPNPMYGLVPAASGQIGQPTVPLYQLLMSFPEYGAFSTIDNPGVGWTQYHSLQVTVQHRFSHGYTFLGSYTWSRLMDQNGYLNPAFVSPSEQRTWNALEHVVDQNNRTNRLVLTGIYNLPFGHGERFGGHETGIVGKLISGWEFSHIYTFQSGDPLQMPNGIMATGAPAGGPRTITQWFNPAALTTVPGLGYPIVPRTLSSFWSQVTGDTINNFDLSLIKNTQITEKTRLQFRAEFFNAFNRPQFGNPDVNPGDSTYDTINSQINDPREIQLAMKFYF